MYKYQHLQLPSSWMSAHYFCHKKHKHSLPSFRDNIVIMYKLSVLLSFLFAQDLVAGLATRQSCPAIHVFGARETTVSPGYGSAGTVVNLILNAHPGATSEAITYPACGGQSSCGGISYANSVVTGTNAVASAVNSYNSRCPTTKLVLVGYSQVSE